MADMEEDLGEAQEWGQSPPVPRALTPSQLSERCSMTISMQSELQNKQAITTR